MDAFLSGYFSALARMCITGSFHNSVIMSQRVQKMPGKWGYFPAILLDPHARADYGWALTEIFIIKVMVVMKPNVLLIKKKTFILYLGLQSLKNTIITMETCRNSLLYFNEGFQGKNQCWCCPCTVLAVSCSGTGSKVCMELDSSPALLSSLHWF